MLRIEEPIGWNIKIEPVDTGYLLDYVESFPNDKEHMQCLMETKDLMSQHPAFTKNIELVEKGTVIELHFRYIGNKQRIINIVAFEFLSFSGLGKRTIQDLAVDLSLASLGVCSTNCNLKKNE